MFGLSSRSRKSWSRLLLAGASAAAVLGVAASAQAAPYAYVANADGDGPSDVSQFNIGAGGLLSALSPPTVAAGSGPEGVAVSPDGKSVYVTNLLDRHALPIRRWRWWQLSPKSPAAVGADPRPGGDGGQPERQGRLRGRQLH